jgi:hypothetical protein
MIIPGSDNALLLNPVSTQYRVERSLRFNSSDSDLWRDIRNTQEVAE